MRSFQDLVILFTRYPHPGKCKTRLTSQLGAEGATLLHQQLTAHTMKTVADFLTQKDKTELIIYHDGGSRPQMKKWLGSRYRYKEQQGIDLGQRMADALIHGLNRTQNTILLGSDCPDITDTILMDGLQALKQKDVVLGPAYDGGYYLIGVANTMEPKLCAQLFEEIPWGGDTVFAKTLRRIEKLGLDCHILKKLHDIDTIEDLKHFHHCPHVE